jgi:hypothetical protein
MKPARNVGVRTAFDSLRMTFENFELKVAAKPSTPESEADNIWAPLRSDVLMEGRDPRATRLLVRSAIDSGYRVGYLIGITGAQILTVLIIITMA